jgi:hypothetical protein
MGLSGLLALGGCGSGSSGDQAAVKHVIESLRTDVVQHEFAAACALLDPGLAGMIGRETLGPPNTCATGLAAAYTRAPTALAELPTGPIRMRANCGYVGPVCHGTDCAAIAPVTVCRSRRGWRVRAL